MSDDGLIPVPDDVEFGQTIRGFAEGQQVFGRYALRQIVGRGGMGLVWLAHDEHLQEEVALKFLPELVRLDNVSLEELRRETRRSRKLSHHHVVRVHDFVSDGTSAAISMEFVNGETLSGLRAKQPNLCFEPGQISEWMRQTIEAIEYAHERAHIVHRDLKPANVMVDYEGCVKVTDFGISSSISESVSRVTVKRGTSGTLVYMSPQQVMGGDPCVQDDIYSFGATLFELITSKPPFYSGDVPSQLREIVPPRMADRRRSLGVEGGPIPQEWEDTVAACLAKDPAQRPLTMGEVAVRLGLRSASAPVAAVKTEDVVKRASEVETPPPESEQPETTSPLPLREDRPALLLTVGVFLLGAWDLCLMFLTPGMKGQFPGEALPAFTIAVLRLNDWLLTHWYMVLPIGVAVAIFAVRRRNRALLWSLLGALLVYAALAMVGITLGFVFHSRPQEVHATRLPPSDHLQQPSASAPSVQNSPAVVQKEQTDKVLSVPADLAAERNVWPQILSALNENIPAGIWITELNPQSDNSPGDPGSSEITSFQIQGLYQTNDKTSQIDISRVKDFVRALAVLPYFEIDSSQPDAVLVSFTTAAQNPDALAQGFSLRLKLKKPIALRTDTVEASLTYITPHGDGVDPMTWKVQLDGQMRTLSAAAATHRVIVHPNDYFSFSRYLAQIPATDETYILSKELDAVKQMASVLIKASVKEIVSIRRVDVSPPVASVVDQKDYLPADLSIREADGFFTVYPFEIAFDCTADSFRTVVNGLTQSDGAFVIRSIVVKNSKPESPTAGNLQQSASPAGAKPLLVFGDEILHVRLRVDFIDWISAASRAEFTGAPPLLWSAPASKRPLFVSDPYYFIPSQYPNGNYMQKEDSRRTAGGILYSWLEKYHLDVDDPGVDMNDPDGDGFSNLQEFKNDQPGQHVNAADCDGSKSTNPIDPQSHPSYLSRLRLEKCQESSNSPVTADFVMLMPSEVGKEIKVQYGGVFDLPRVSEQYRLIDDFKNDGVVVQEVKSLQEFHISKLVPSDLYEVPRSKSP